MVRTYTPQTSDREVLQDLRAPSGLRLRSGSIEASVRVLLLLALDGCLSFAAWLAAGRVGTPYLTSWSFEVNPAGALYVVGTTVLMLAFQGFYGPSNRRRHYPRLVFSLLFAELLLLLLAFLISPGMFVSRSTFLWYGAISTVLVTGGRITLDTLLTALRSAGTARYNVALIGDPEDTAIGATLLGHEDRYQITARLTEVDPVGPQIERLRAQGVSAVFCCSWERLANPQLFYWQMRSAGITVHILPVNLTAYPQHPTLRMLGSVPVLQFTPPLIAGSDWWVKRAFDFCAASLLLLLTAPVFLVISLAIALDSPGGIFFRQPRIGLNGRQFLVWKFRTMVSDAEKLQAKLEAKNEMADGVLFKIKSDPRITRVGAFLRRYSLDELPQLFNVLCGNMSLVGPRPFPIRDVERFAAHHAARHNVLPGITGLWQVSGRSEVTNFDEVFRLDMAYINNWSLLLDLEILLRTVFVVLGKRGAY